MYVCMDGCMYAAANKELSSAKLGIGALQRKKNKDWSKNETGLLLLWDLEGDKKLCFENDVFIIYTNTLISVCEIRKNMG